MDYEDDAVMTKRNEERNNSTVCIMLAYCIFLYALGIVLLYFKMLLGLGLIFISTLFFVPTLGEARKKRRSNLTFSIIMFQLLMMKRQKVS